MSKLELSEKQVTEEDRSQTDVEILRAVHDVRYGSIEITVHDGKVVQIERREKTRFSSH